jgi:nucleoside-diphosphate-sugar epimerase
MAEILVTGATGLAGRSLVPHLLEGGHVVRALVRRAEDGPALERRGAVPFVGDLLEPMSLERACAGCDVVVHAAAHVAFGARLRTLSAVNVQGTSNVIAAARSHGVRRLVAVGAAATLLGGRLVHDADETWPYPARPIGPYTRTKAEAEQLVLAANDASLETVALRPALLWGEGSVFIAEIIRICRRRGFVWIAGGGYRFSTCHADNLAAAVGRAIEQGRGGRSYLVADAERSSFREFATAVLNGLDLDPGSRVVPRWLTRLMAGLVETLCYPFVGSRQPPMSRELIAMIGDPLDVSCDRAVRELGYAPLVSRGQAIERLREWHRKRDAR